MSRSEWPTVLEKWVTLLWSRIVEGGSATEDSHPRNGFLSYQSETHALAVGFGVGMVASSGLLGDESEAFVGAIVAAAFGLNRGPELSSPKVMEDIAHEPHYALAGLAVGLLFGFTPNEIVDQVWQAVPA